MEQTFTVVVDAARVAAARPVFAAAMIAQQRAIHARFVPPWMLKWCVPFGWFGVVISAISLAAKLEPWWYFATGGVAGLFLALVVPRMQGSWGWRERLIHWAAGKITARTIKIAPFTALYRFVGDELHVSVDRPLVERRIKAGDIAIAYRSDVVYLFFKRPTSRRWSALVYVGDEKLRAALDAFLAAHQLSVHDV